MFNGLYGKIIEYCKSVYLIYLARSSKIIVFHKMANNQNYSPSDSQEKQRIHCNECGRVTIHKSVASHFSGTKYHILLADNSEHKFDIIQKWELLECCGCESVTTRYLITSGSAGKEEIVEEEFFPARKIFHHHAKYYETLPLHLKHIYEEIVFAFNQSSLVLCVAGLRILLEGVCADKGIINGARQDGKIVETLEGKINGLASFVPQNIVNRLHSIRLLGNIAIHQLETLEKEDVEVALYVVEDVLNLIYDLDYYSSIVATNAENLKSNLQSRQSGK